MLIVDPITGAMWKLDTPEINATLHTTTALREPTLKVMDIKDVPESMKDKLVRVK